MQGKDNMLFEVCPYNPGRGSVTIDVDKSIVRIGLYVELQDYIRKNMGLKYPSPMTYAFDTYTEYYEWGIAGTLVHESVHQVIEDVVPEKKVCRWIKCKNRGNIQVLIRLTSAFDDIDGELEITHTGMYERLPDDEWMLYSYWWAMFDSPEVVRMTKEWDRLIKRHEELKELMAVKYEEYVEDLNQKR